jgi:Na+/melibiose symporter-like transporter
MSSAKAVHPPFPARLPFRTKFTWALGSLGDNYAGNTISQLKDAVYTVALGVPPELIGWALSLPRLLDAFFDPMIGFVSDNTRSRWGRRRPFIFTGAIALGLTMTLLWLPPSHAGWSPTALAALLGGYLVSRCGYVAGSNPGMPTLLQLRATLVATPLVGLGLAAAVIAGYPLSRTRLGEIQALLKSRRARPTL